MSLAFSPTFFILRENAVLNSAAAIKSAAIIRNTIIGEGAVNYAIVGKNS